MKLDFTCAELFTDLSTQMVIENRHVVDMHNEMKCSSIEIDSCELTMKVYFHKVEAFVESKIAGRLEFTNVSFRKFNIRLDEMTFVQTINVMCRGRFEHLGQVLEFNQYGHPYFYLEFETGISLEFFCSKAELFLQ